MSTEFLKKLDISPDELFSPEELTEKYNQEVAHFFNTEPIKDIKTIICDSQKILVDAYKKYYPEKEAPGWLVGFSPANYIYILAPQAMTPDTDPGPLRFRKVLKHEIVHKYLNKLPGNPPLYLVEGTCCFIADQVKNKLDLNKITLRLLEKVSAAETDPEGYVYTIGKNLVGEIINKFGKEKLLELIKIENRTEIIKELKRMFGWLK